MTFYVCCSPRPLPPPLPAPSINQNSSLVVLFGVFSPQSLPTPNTGSKAAAANPRPAGQTRSTGVHALIGLGMLREHKSILRT